MDRKSGFLDGKEEIKSFLNDIKKDKLNMLVNAGLPVRIEGNRWYAHKENIERFLIWWTNLDNTGKSK